MKALTQLITRLSARGQPVDENLHTGGVGTPTLLLYFDEAHTAQIPIQIDSKRRTNYSALTQAIDAFKATSLLAVFTSTTSRLYELAPPQIVHNSARVIANDVIPLPFWELPFDTHVGRIPIGTVTIDEITSIKHIVKFGRPL